MLCSSMDAPTLRVRRAAAEASGALLGNVSKNVFSYVAMYKNKSRISESAVFAMTKIIDARD